MSVRIRVRRPTEAERAAGAAEWAEFYASRGRPLVIRLPSRDVAAARPTEDECEVCVAEPEPVMAAPPLPPWTDRQRAIVAAAIRDHHRELITEDVEFHREGLRQCADELADLVDSTLRRRRELRARVFGVGMR